MVSKKVSGKKKRISARRSWCFTLNNPSAAAIDKIKSFKDFPESYRYVILQTETGTQESTTHLQGYLELSKRKRLSGVKKILPRAHWEARLGTQLEAITYCKKTESRVKDGWSYEWGTPYRSKCSSDLIDSIQNGASMLELAEEHPRAFLHNSTGIQAFREQLQTARKSAPEIVIYWGPTGTGKSSTAWANWPLAYASSWPAGSRWWWDKYDHQDTVICDEFCMQIKLQVMLKFLDRHPMYVEYKGGTTQMNSTRIVICSNVDPLDWYNKCKSVMRLALFRRLVEFATVYHLADTVSDPADVELVVDGRFDTMTTVRESLGLIVDDSVVTDYHPYDYDFVAD